MIPRGRLDIGWSHILYGAVACAAPTSRRAAEERLERLIDDPGVLITLSVRSGLDLFLTVMDYPPGSEILVSAVTIRNMVDIVEDHGLVAVPVDMDMDRLTVKRESLEAARSPRSRAILVAHLLGSRMDLGWIGEFAREHDLMLVEDCAQSFTGSGYWGHPGAHVTLTSFGPLKTATALGGAVGIVRDSDLLARMRRLQESWPVQGRVTYLKRVLRFGTVRLLMYPALFELFYRACRLLGRNHDDVFNQSIRGFTGARFFWKIRHRPSTPLLLLMAHRIRGYGNRQIGARIESARHAAENMPGVPRPGRTATGHTHWVFPVLADDPDALAAYLWEHGFDATRGKWSLYVVPQPDGDPRTGAPEAHGVMSRVLYVPAYPAVPRRRVERLAARITEWIRTREHPRMPDPDAPAS